MAMQLTRRAVTASALAAIAAPARAAGWDDGARPEWAKVLAAAKSEGPVVVLGRPDLGKPFAEGFKRDTGLSLEYLGGTTRELQARWRREAASGNIQSDILLGGETVVDMIEPGHLMPLADKLYLPGVTEGKNWVNGAITWGDNGKTYLFIGGEYVNCWPVFSTNLVKPGEITKWAQLLDPKWKGKIAAFDPREGAGGAGAAHIMDVMGVDFYRKLVKDQQVQMARDGRQVIEWLARGTHAIALGAVPPDIEYFRTRTKNIVVGDMEENAGSLLGGSSILTIAARTPRPNASIAFLNWYASKPGQETYSKAWMTPSNRVDVSIPNIPDYTIPKPGKVYLEQYRETWWRQKRTVYEGVIEELLGK